MLYAYSESRRKRATWKVMFEMGENAESMVPRGVKGQRSYTSPSLVLGTKERGQNVLSVREVGRRLPSALTHIVTAPLDQILEATATLARPQDALDFVLNGAIREFDRGRSRRKSVIRVGAVRLEETRVEGVVDRAIQNGLGKI